DGPARERRRGQDVHELVPYGPFQRAALAQDRQRDEIHLGTDRRSGGEPRLSSRALVALHGWMKTQRELRGCRHTELLHQAVARARREILKHRALILIPFG